jgi:hypothetical protein
MSNETLPKDFGLTLKIRRNSLHRWIIVHPQLDELAWSGSRWVEIDYNGLPREVQVCNFETASEAAKYAEEHLLVEVA